MTKRGNIVATMIGFLVAIASSKVSADGKQHECKPSGLPSQLGQTGAVAVAQPVDYWSKPWLLVTDKQTRPDKIRLVSPQGEVVEIGKPPITVDPLLWLARGRAVYALGRGRSQIAGKVDVTLLRWATDPRPRLTILRTVDSIEAPITAAFESEFLAVSWAEKAKDGVLHRMVSFLDSEELRVGEPTDLGPDSGAIARVQALTKGFVVLWTSPAGLSRAIFNQFGKSTAPIVSLTTTNASPVLGLLQCADRSWLVHEAGKELALEVGGAEGPMSELARLPMAPHEELLAFQCVDDAVVIGRRTLDVKASNITLWISTVDAKGKVRDRRIKDSRGGLDEIRMPQFSQIGEKLTSWWIEGQGLEAKVWSRPISCD
jgi:hypothetical protein